GDLRGRGGQGWGHERSTTMKQFRDKVAVVTGAGSGIGRGLAERFAAEGMKVVLADGQEDALARRTLEEFGAVHIVCNNAGVSGGGGPVWTATEADWRWVLGVNLFGVIHGIRTFVPVMLEQGTEGHIVNTASVLGLMTGPGGGPYGASKHAVVRITEGLQYDLIAAGS